MGKENGQLKSRCVDRLGIPQGDVWFGHVFFHVDRLVEVVVDEVILGRLLADVVAGWWHTDQVHLMECEAFRTDPGVFLIFLAVVEHFAAQTFVSVVSGGASCTVEI